MIGTTIRNRYRIETEIGRGGMGVVYRAHDILQNRPVAVKLISTTQIEFTHIEAVTPSDDTPDTSRLHLALAQEFQTLASLRHPHIISVQDYGFDDEKRPFFTMMYLPDAQTILESSRKVPLQQKIHFLIQALQALAYLHRRKILHRDLKPANILVTDGSAKLLDFGLSAKRDEAGGSAGTLNYMAPELLDPDERATESSDLYAIGVIAYELFAGQSPYPASNLRDMVQAILTQPPNLTLMDAPGEVVAVVKRLLRKSPTDRYADANEVMAALSQAMGELPQQESLAIRESFLQAATFVGREAELNQLANALDGVTADAGALWLIGGESGVGKSRLINELRIRALVKGCVLLEGESLSEGASPYHMWREPLRRMMLAKDIADSEASVLKALIPDIDEMLEHPILDVPEVDPKAAQDRLLNAIENLFRQQATAQAYPLVLILEDLHWANTESVVALNRLIPAFAKMRVFVVGTYRDDEKPDLPASLAGMKVLNLNRLSENSMVELSEAMLGVPGRDPRLLDLLRRETEGNIFFVIEVVRALAEEAGYLSNIGNLSLPAHVFASGIYQIIERRVNKVPEAYRPLLRLAAVLGRQVDDKVLRAAAPSTDMENWLTVCANAAVLEVRDGVWRFAHDKLRETLLDWMSDDQRVELHGHIALAIESAYPDQPEYAASLAYHWTQAQNTEKAIEYLGKAGEQALRSYANQEAINYLSEAIRLEVERGNKESKLHRAMWERQLGEAYLRLSHIDESLTHLRNAMSLLGEPIPLERNRLVFNLFYQALRQLWHVLWRSRYVIQDDAASATPLSSGAVVLFEIARTCNLLAEVYFFVNDALSTIYTTLLIINSAERAKGNSPELAYAYGAMAFIAGFIPLRPVAEMYGQRAQETASRLNQPYSLAQVDFLVGLYYIGIGDWAKAITLQDRALEIFERLGDRRRSVTNLTSRTFIDYCQGHLDESAKKWSEVYKLAGQNGDVQQQPWGLYGRASCLLRLGRLNESFDLLNEALPLIPSDYATGRIIPAGVLAATHWRRGETEQAYQAAEITLQYIMQVPAPTNASTIQGYIGAAEAFVGLWEKEKEQTLRLKIRESAWQLSRAIRSFARVFLLAQPQAHLYQGTCLWLDGKPSEARKAWQKSLENAQTLAMPYEEGLAHYEIGRHATGAEREQHLSCAREIFSRLGAVYNLDLVQTALDNRRS